MQPHRPQPLFAISTILFTCWLLSLPPTTHAITKSIINNLEQYAAPWVAPPDVRFDYQGLHNDLRRLLGQQALRQSISVTFFTTAQRPMLLNCIYSLIKYGRALNYIVVTIDHQSLAECLRLRLPCYNATHLLGDFASGTDYPFGSAQYRKLVHSKPAIVWEVLRLGLNVHFTDVDVSFLRRVWPSFNRYMQLTGADMAFMNEYTHLNTGNFVIRYNERTVQAVRAWATAAPERDKYGWGGGRGGGMHTREGRWSAKRAPMLHTWWCIGIAIPSFCGDCMGYLW